MPRWNATRLERISKVLDEKIKNLEPNLRQSLEARLLLIGLSENLSKCRNYVTQLLGIASGDNQRKSAYWVSRGWNETVAKIKSKNAATTGSKKRISPYSKEFWMSKVNPVTGVFYTDNEADFERNCRRPIRKEYWTQQGHTEDDAKQLALDHKKSNNQKGAVGSKCLSAYSQRTKSPRTLDYWLCRGYSTSDAAQKLKETQTTNGMEFYTKKYGIEQADEKFNLRIEKWLNSAGNKHMVRGRSQNAIKLFDLLNGGEYGENERVVRGKLRSHRVDYLNGNKIIEYFGDYWHGNPLVYEEAGLIRNKKVSSIWAHDFDKINDLISVGFDVIVIWEREFNCNKEETIKKCIQFLNR